MTWSGLLTACLGANDGQFGKTLVASSPPKRFGMVQKSPPLSAKKTPPGEKKLPFWAVPDRLEIAGNAQARSVCGRLFE